MAECKICSKEKGKYVCPRCNVLYCSLPCYQSEAHINCSEAFYRDCVLEDMKSRDPDPSTEKKMYEVLGRLQKSCDDEEENLDSDDEDSIPDLQERLQNVNLDDADAVWEKLTPAERKDFEELLQSGDVNELVTPWEPWWLYRKQKILVEELENNDAVNFNYELHCPPLKKNISPFSQISKTAPSPCVKYNVLNVLAAYCYTVRFFNGEHHSTSSESTSTLVNLSSNLGLNHVHDSAVIAVEAVAHEAVNCPGISASPESIACMKKDVECMLTGPEEDKCNFYLQAALSDMHKLFTEAKTTKDEGLTGGKVSGEFTKRYSENSAILPVPKDKLKLCIKKLEYYLSWSQEHSVKFVMEYQIDKFL